MGRSAWPLIAPLFLLSVVSAQTPPGSTHPVYQELRGLAVGTEAYQINGFVLKKDAASFTLTGTIYKMPA
jgi:hypothetical protein